VLQKKWAEISGIREKTRIEKVKKQSEWTIVFFTAVSFLQWHQ